MDIISNNPIEVYQLINDEWIKLPRPVTIYLNTYRVQIMSIGTYAVKNLEYVPNVKINGSLSANAIQDKMSLNVSEIKSKDEKIYTNLKLLIEDIILKFQNTFVSLTARIR